MMGCDDCYSFICSVEFIETNVGLIAVKYASCVLTIDLLSSGTNSGYRIGSTRGQKKIDRLRTWMSQEVRIKG